MNRTLQYVGLLLLTSLITYTALAEDFRWIVTYPNASNPWGRKMASGEVKTVMKLQFIDLDHSEDYKVTQLAVRPVTNASQWFIESLQLWVNRDDYRGSLDRAADSLLDTQAIGAIDVQSDPTNRITFSLPDDGEWILGDTATFFVTMVVQDWRTPDPEDREISGQHGAAFGITVQKDEEDIRVATLGDNYDKTSNNWGGDPSLFYQIQAVNLPIVVYNRNRSAEEDSNMFFANYAAIDGSAASKAQILTDLSFAAHVFLPHLDTERGDSLSYASFKLGWDNRVLELDSIAFGDAWDGKQYQENGWEESGYNESTLPGDTTRSVVRFEAIVMGNSESPQNYVDIANNSLGVFYFRIIKPGISPLFLAEVTILDQWGIPYHTYRTLQNEVDPDDPYDAWSKYILGDFTGTISGDLNDGHCDAQIDPLTDVSLFSNHLWLNPDSADWYERFDIGSDSVGYDPDELSPDDTTNFFDLMVIGTNYYRTLRGEFDQKMVVNRDRPCVDLKIDDVTVTPLTLRIRIESMPELIAGQIKLDFDPQDFRLRSLLPGDWIQSLSPRHFLTHAPQSLKNGTVDILFLALERPLSGTGDFVVLQLIPLTQDPGPISIRQIDLRDRHCQQIQLVNVDQKIEIAPRHFRLLANYPNPFNPDTRIQYTIPEGRAGVYHLTIFDLQGRAVRQLLADHRTSGNYTILWDGKDDRGISVGSGIYLLRLQGEHVRRHCKLTLLR